LVGWNRTVEELFTWDSSSEDDSASDQEQPWDDETFVEPEEEEWTEQPEEEEWTEPMPEE